MPSTTGERFAPAVLVDWLGERRGAPVTLRWAAKRLGIDAAVLCRPWSARQADKYATCLGAHPGEIWPTWWEGIEDEEDEEDAAHEESDYAVIQCEP